MKKVHPKRLPHFCYQCGNRLNAGAERCWYCSMQVQRELRPLKQCPFCAEPVRAEAVKCRHCGEFLDGRPRREERPVQQMIVIDKDALKAMNDLRLFPGLPVPDAAKRVLDARTVRAIENNRPEQIEHPSIRLLPAPSDSPAAIEGRSGEAPDGGKSLPAVRSAGAEEGGGDYPLAMRSAGAGEAEGKQLPARSKFAPLAKAKKQLPAVRTPPASAGGGKAGAADDAMDAVVDETFRLCHKCQTEILAIDNYCYYCGTQYHRTQRDDWRKSAAQRKSFRRIFKLIVLLVIVGAIAAGAYLLWIAGYLSDRERFDELTEKVGAGVGELKTIDPRVTSAAKTCRENLALMDSAKRSAAKREGITTGTVALAEILKELQSSSLPICPVGGAYSINALDQVTTCSIGTNGTVATSDDHVIPAR